MHWYERLPQRWETEQRIASQVLEDADSGIKEDGVAFVDGKFHIMSEHGHVYETATIRIEYPQSYPNGGQPPDVILLSHRNCWRAIPDAHIFPDWRLCLYVAGESPVNFSMDDSLNGLFAVLNTFLFKERVFQRALARQGLTGELAIWPGEARSHRFDGIEEAIREMGHVGRNQHCPCGSGSKFKNCCMRKVRR
jgi:hypothetical protein